MLLLETKQVTVSSNSVIRIMDANTKKFQITTDGKIQQYKIVEPLMLQNQSDIAQFALAA